MTPATAATARRHASLVLVRACFVGGVVAMAWNQPAWDLTATYVAGRLVATGHTAALYDQAAGNAAMRPGSYWANAAEAGGIADHVVTPYIQTPFWACVVAPLAAAVSFAAFKRIFAALSAIAVVAMIGLAAARWAPALAGPAWQAGLLAGLGLSVPFEAGLLLGQTHTLFLCLAVWAAAIVSRGRDVAAGGLLAVAVAVKLTPVWIALTWLVGGRTRPVASFAAWSALLAGLAWAGAGWPVCRGYLQILHGLGASVILSFNNDSLATVLMAGGLNDATAFQFATLPMPAWVAATSAVLLASCAVLAGVLDRRRAQPVRQTGAIITLVAATAFTPLAWNHYFVVLVLPAMLFLDSGRSSGKVVWLVLVTAVLALDIEPLAYTIGAPLSTVAHRSHFWAAMLCLCALPFAGARPAAIPPRPGNEAETPALSLP